MAEISQKTKYVKLDDGVSFALVRTNPKLTTNTKLMYNGKKMYMESYASCELLNRAAYKNVSVKPKSTYNKDIANFLVGTGSQAYEVHQNFSNIVISDSFDNQFENFYWCGAEYIDSYSYDEEIGFVAPLYLREKLPNYFLIFRLDTPSNYNFNIDDVTRQIKDKTFDFKEDILDKAVLIKTFDLREGSVLGNYIHNYIEQDGFEFDKSMYVNFSNAEVTYYGINKTNGVFEKKVESFENELLRNDNPVMYDDKWFTEGYERNGLIFPYIINIEYLFNDDNFKKENGEELYDFARYIGVYCNNIEFGEFADLDELSNSGNTVDNTIYYFEDNKNNLHRYTNSESGLKIDGKDSKLFDKNLISGYEKERITAYAEPLDIYEGFINRAQYGIEILKPLEPGDWIGIEYDGHVECYFADNKNLNNGEKYDMLIGEYSDFRFSVNENSSLSDIADALVKSINYNKKSKFEAKCSDNIVVIYAKREGKEYNGSENGGAKILMEASLLYNRKISLPISNSINFVNLSTLGTEGFVKNYDKSLFGNYYTDYFCGACDADIDPRTDTYKNVFKIYAEESVFFGLNRYLKTNGGHGRRINTNIVFINEEGKIDPIYRLVIVDDAPDDKKGLSAYDVSVSSTNQVEIMDKFKPDHGVLSWFPVRDFDFDMNYSTYGLYKAFSDECEKLSKKITYKQDSNTNDTADSDEISVFEDSIVGIKELAQPPFFDDFGGSLTSEYDYYNEQINPNLCLISKTAPFISKWGYYDEQKDSCENPYRLNVNKVFGVSNLSANTFLRNCNANEYTHSMPYYMTLNTPDYYKDYQYIASDEVYSKHFTKKEEETKNIDIENNGLETFFNCVDYWLGIFKDTEEDMFAYFFSGKKYAKRFDRKYSRFLGGDKFHHSSTLFRGVKFEVVRQYGGLDKRTNQYNDYKFSFVYIPVMLDTMIFNSTIHFVKNDTFKFIVGIIFVNTMLGTYGHNIFQGNVDYFNKGFLYSACNDIIRPEHTKNYNYDLTLKTNSEEYIIKGTYNDVWKKNYKFNKTENIFYMWKGIIDGQEKIFVTNSDDPKEISNIIGEIVYNKENGIEENIKNKDLFTSLKTDLDSLSVVEEGNIKKMIVKWNRYYDNFDTTIYGFSNFEYYGDIKCVMSAPYITLKDNVLVDICNIDWEPYDENGYFGYRLDASKLYLRSESIQNMLINLGLKNSVKCIKFHNINGNDKVFVTNDGDFNEDEIDSLVEPIKCKILVDVKTGNITIESADTLLEEDFADINDLLVDFTIKDEFNDNLESFGLKNYFSVFEQLSMFNITKCINDNYNVEYHSTVESDIYKIRVIEPDSIEIVDIYESTPLIITQNNKRVIGAVDIQRKVNIDKIGKKVINRYSGYYNPIFNDILYFDDYSYTKNVGRLKNMVNFDLPYSNTNIDYNYNDGYGKFGVIKNVYFHKTNTTRSDKILTSEKPVYPAINEYALDYRDYNVFSSSWDEGYFISQDDLDNISICEGIGSMKDGLCMFGSKYLNLPDSIFIDTFENGKNWDDKMDIDIRDISDTEIMYKEINDRTVRYHLFLEKRLKRYLKESLFDIFDKYINKKYSFGNKGTIEDDVDEYVEKNLLKLYDVDKVYMYIKSDRMNINDKLIENDYLKYVGKDNESKIKKGFPVITAYGETKLKDEKFTMSKANMFDRTITYNLKSGFKEGFGFAVSFRRK